MILKSIVVFLYLITFELYMPDRSSLCRSGTGGSMRGKLQQTVCEQLAWRIQHAWLDWDPTHFITLLFWPITVLALGRPLHAPPSSPKSPVRIFWIQWHSRGNLRWKWERILAFFYHTVIIVYLEWVIWQNISILEDIPPMHNMYHNICLLSSSR